ANTTAKGATSIHGTNPQFLIDKVLRSRIYDCQYWKEYCFGLTAESLIDRAVELKFVGSSYSNNVRPTQFICLLLKLLQLQPDREIILEYLRADEFKYLRALAAFYVRLTFDHLNVYQTLEPLLSDYRKLRKRNLDGSYSLMTFDELIDELLSQTIVLDVVLPRLTSRSVLEQNEGLAERRSMLGVAIGIQSEDDEVDRDDKEDDEIDGDDDDRFISRSNSPSSRIQSPTSARFISRDPTPDQIDDNSDRFISRDPTPDL
ncbi:PRP38 family-domain-containing protein, partial [Phakopsora pachyrhizi]